MSVGKAYKCPQISTMKVLVHESFEFGGFCKGPRLAVHHNIARWLGGEFCEKIKFVIFEMRGLERPTKCPQMNTMKVLVREMFQFGGFCTGPSWSEHHGIARWLGGEFCEKFKFVTFEM